MVLLGNCMPLVRRYVGLFAGSGIFLKDGHSHHLSGFFSGDCVHEEVLDEDLWSCGVWCTVLAVVVLLEIVLLRYGLEDSTDLNGLALGMSHTVAQRS